MSQERKPGETSFSGRVRLITVDGVVDLDIREAQVLQGLEILQKGPRPQLESATNHLRDIRKQLRGESSAKASLECIKRSKYWLEQDGSQSIATLLLPQTSLESRVFNALTRSSIFTKRDLVKNPLIEVGGLRQVGKRGFLLINAMRDVAIAQIADESSP